MQLLSDYFLTTRHEFPYKMDASTYFSPYADHRAVVMFREMSGARFGFDAVPVAMLALSEPPELRSRMPFPERATSAAGGSKRLNEFVAALRDFAVTSEFTRFFESHRATFARVVDGARDDVQRAVGVLTGYTGLEPRNSTVILGLLLHDGGFGPRLQPTADSMEVYAIMGPHRSVDGPPVFGPAERLMGTTWHEFAHTFINPLTRERAQEVERYAILYDPVAEQMERWAYGNWETVVNEHIVRAIETRLTERTLGADAGAQEREGHVERGFRYLDPLLERLREYEEDPDRYPTITGFYPRLLDVFEEAAPSSRGGRHRWRAPAPLSRNRGPDRLLVEPADRR